MNDFCVHREADPDTGSPGHTRPATSAERRRGSTPRQRPHGSDHGFRGKREPAGAQRHTGTALRSCTTGIGNSESSSLEWRRSSGPPRHARSSLLGPLAPRARGQLTTWRGRGAWSRGPARPPHRACAGRAPPAAQPVRGWGHRGPWRCRRLRRRPVCTSECSF